MRVALILSLIAGVVGYHYAAPAAAGPTLYTTDGVRIPMKPAGSVDWSGPGMTGASMPVVCAGNGLVFGLMASHAIGLNGYSASWRRDGYVRNAKGAKLAIVPGDKTDLVAAGLITAAVEPMTFNAKTAEGLDVGRRVCPF